MSQMGMDLAANYTLPNRNAWYKILGWTVRSGFPSTVITSDALVMDVSRTGVTVSARVTWDINTGTGQQIQVVKNGTTVVLGPVSNVSGVTQTATINITAGDTLELQGQSNSTGGFAQVDAGSTKTFLTVTYSPIAYTADASTSIGWNMSAGTSMVKPTQGALAIGWNSDSATSVTKLAQGSASIGWSLDADSRKGVHYTASGALAIGWSMDADLLYTPKPVNPPSIFTFNEVSASVHTVDGRTVGHFPCNVVGNFSWGRESSEVSTCNFDVLRQGIDVAEIVEDLRPWVHWVTFWHDDIAVWTGPIQQIKIATNTATISARDTSTLMWRTRIPISRSWTDTSPADIASLLWLRMLELHRVRTTPVVVSNVVTEVFSLTATADSRLLNQFMDDLVKVGLHWTVVAGRPVLGIFPRTPVAELAECDFMVEIQRLRDGTQTFNDVRVQGKNYVSTVTAPLAGLHLQTLVSLDDVFGVSNITKAAQTYTTRHAQIRDVLSIPGSASLHPEAPVTLDDLVPGKMFRVTAQGVTNLMRLDAMEVSGSPETFDVRVTLVADNPLSELDIATGGSGL